MRVATWLAPLSLLLALAACSRPDPLPDLGLSATSVRFEAPAAAGDPAPQSIFLTNSGSGAVERPTAQVAFQDGSGWLTAAVAGDGAPYEIRLAASVGGLAPGSYRATLTVTSPSLSGDPLQAAVLLEVPEPRFALSASTLAFQAPRGGGNPAAQEIQVTNGGRGTLPVPQVAISYVGASGWLSAAVGGTPDGYSLSARADATGLASGTYSATVTFTAAGGSAPPRTLAVSLTVPPEELALSTAAVEIVGTADDSAPAPAGLTATNAGGGPMPPPQGTVDPAAATWLTDVQVAGSAAPYLIQIRASQVGLPAGSYTGRVWFGLPGAAEASRLAVQVTLHVPPASILVSAHDFSFIQGEGCGLPAPRTALLFGSRMGTLRSVAAAVDAGAASWLDAEVTGAREPFTITLRPKGTPPPGRSPFQILLSGSDGAAGVLYGQYTVLPYAVPPGMLPPPYPSPWTLAFHGQLGAGDPAPQRIHVVNASCATVPTASVLPAEAGTWLGAEPDPGPHVLVRPQIAGFATGETRTAAVRLGGFSYVPSQGAPANPDVTVTVTASALQPTGSLSEPRYGHVLLAHSSGLVIAAGGENQLGEPLRSVETYDPATGLWSLTQSVEGALGKPRYRPGAVELADGRVLLCGGLVRGAPAPGPTDLTCEIRSATGSWSPAGTLQKGRLDPRLVALPGNRVLVAGGDLGEPVELFDVASGTSTMLTLANGARDTAVLLPNGLVLVAGRTASQLAPQDGSASSGETALYDPASGRSWPTGTLQRTLQGDLPCAETLHLLPDGRVLELGRNAQIWDPVTGVWSAAAAPRANRGFRSTVMLANGRILGVGGWFSYPGASDELEVFDPATGSWSVAGRLPKAYGGLPVVRLPSGMLVLAGGSEGSSGEAFTW